MIIVATSEWLHMKVSERKSVFALSNSLATGVNVVSLFDVRLPGRSMRTGREGGESGLFVVKLR